MSRTISILAAFAALVAGTLLIVHAYRGSGNSPRVAEANGHEMEAHAGVNAPQESAENEPSKPQNAPAAKPESEVPKPAAKPEGETPKPQGDVAKTPEPASSAPTGPEVSYDFNRLPDEVRDTVQSIVVAAQSGNIDSMLPVLQENELPPMLAATAVSDPIAFWKKASADGKGTDILAAMVNVFSSGYLRKSDGKNVMFVWPYFAEMDLTKLTPAQEVDFYRVVPPSLGGDMKKSGKYTYYRAGIGSDGVWHYFMQ
jgi:hypothetical protein